MRIDESHADVLSMLKATFDMVKRRIEFYDNSADQKLALAHLDRAYEYTIHLAKQEYVEVLDGRGILANWNDSRRK